MQMTVEDTKSIIEMMGVGSSICVVTNERIRDLLIGLLRKIVG